jgi:thioredoxin reductase
MDESYDVVVAGGGAAGLSGALALARSRRSVLVADAGDPRNAPAGQVHNFLTRDGTPPAEIYATGRGEVTRYGGEVCDARVTALSRSGGWFRAEIGGRAVAARRLLVATGLCDEVPAVPGLAARWGNDVVHCPYCHGWEVRDKRIGVLATGPMAMHQALLFRQLSPHVTLLRHTGPALTGEEPGQLAALGVAVVEGVVEEIEAVADRLTAARLAGGRRVPLDVVAVAPRFMARAELLAPLGLTPVEIRAGEYLIGTRIEADATGATAVPGVWVAGNLTDPQAQVVTAAAAGLAAGAAINFDLASEDAGRAVGSYPRSA